MRLTALLHHVYDLSRLRAAFFALKKDAAPGVDGETWRHYEPALEANLRHLSERLKRGAYRANFKRRDAGAVDQARLESNSGDAHQVMRKHLVAQ